MRKFSRRKLLALAGSAAAVAAAGGAARLRFGGRDASRANAILIASDSLRADRLGCYGYSATAVARGGSLTPNIDALAARGILYERCLSTSSWTMQSVASYMTSRLPFVQGPHYNEGFAPAACMTLAQALQNAGYATAALVKNPWLWARNADGSRDIAAARGFQTYNTGYMTLVDNPLHADGIGEEQVYSRFADAASAVRQAAMLLPEFKRGGKPFFLYMHLMDTHEPYNPPDRCRATCTVPEVPGIPDFMLHQAMRTYAKRRGAEALAASDAPLFERARGLYETCVRFVDEEVGKLIGYLSGQGLLDETIIIFSSDHGEEFGEHGWIGHSATLYDESLHVPLVIAGPGAAAGARISEPVSLLDLAPTVLRACGAAAPETMFGRALDLSGGSSMVVPAAAASLVRPDGAEALNEKIHAIADARGFKLHRREYLGDKAATPARDELYDLRSDPREQADAAAARPEVAAALGRHLELLRAAGTGTAGKGIEIDEETRRQLKAIGYLGG